MLDLFNQPEFHRHFSGSDYVPKHDQKRLTGQIERVYLLLCGSGWLTLSEMEKALNDLHPEHHHPQASISAQIRNLRKIQFGSHEIEKRPRGDRGNGLYEYKLLR
jgi:hypothetical protein